MIRKSISNAVQWVVLLLLIVWTSELHAQYNDAALWLSAGVNKKISKNLSATVNPEIRLNENMSELSRFYIDAGLNYKIVKNLKAGAYYRFIATRKLDNSYQSQHRFYGELQYKFKYRKITTTYRLRYQSQYKDHGAGVDFTTSSNYFRNKVSVKYNTKKRWTPNAEGELWTDVKNKINDNYRVGLGIDYEINKRQSLNISYLINREFNVSNPATSYIVFLGYDFSF
jgi:opacity protein-like surface antigen